MKDCEKIQSELIDMYYGELDDKGIKEHLSECEECRKFYEGLEVMALRMDSLKTENPISISDIINVLDKAEDIGVKRKNNFEAFTFVLIGVLLLTTIVLAAVVFGPGLILVMQLIIYSCLPLLMVPLIRSREPKEGLK